MSRSGCCLRCLADPCDCVRAFNAQAVDRLVPFQCAGCLSRDCTRAVRMGVEVFGEAIASDETVCLCEACFQRDVRGHE